MSDTPENSVLCSIVRIFDQDNIAIGVGFLTRENFVITCAHVINSALRRGDLNEKPDDAIMIDFPFLGNKRKLVAKTSFWNFIEDIAVIRIKGKLPKDAAPVILKMKSDYGGHDCSAYGFPRGKGYEKGVWALGTIRSFNDRGWLQFDMKGSTGYAIRPGFSGSPVWDGTLNGIIGMVVEVDVSQNVNSGIIIPVNKIMAIWKDLPVPVDHPFPQGDIEKYLEKIQIWAISYQEYISGWSGFYTPLQIQNLPALVVQYLAADENEKTNEGTANILDAINQNKRLILVGDPGSGKTTTALKLSYDLANSYKINLRGKIPVLVSLRELSPTKGIIELIHDSFARFGILIEIPELEMLIFNSDLLYLVIDGVNEISREARLFGALKEFSQLINSTQCSALITTRREGYDPKLFSEIPSVVILPLDETRMRTFLDEHYPKISSHLFAELGSYSEKHRIGGDFYRDFFRNPLLLNMVAYTFVKTGQLPSTKGELLDRFSSYIVKDAEEGKGSQFDALVREKIQESIAKVMLERGRQISIERNSFIEILSKILGELKEQNQITSDVVVSSILNEVDRRVFRFLRSIPDNTMIEWEHSLFQEYFAAKNTLSRLLAYRDKKSRIEIILAQIGPEWFEVFRVLIEIAKKDMAHEVIDILLDLNLPFAIVVFSAIPDVMRLQYIGKVLDKIERALEDREKLLLREEIVGSLKLLGTDAVYILISLLGNDDYRIRREAARCLDAINPVSMENLPEHNSQFGEIRKDSPNILAFCKKASDRSVTRWRLWALAELLSDKAPRYYHAYDVLKKFLEDLYAQDDPEVQMEAAYGLVSLGKFSLAEGMIESILSRNLAQYPRQGTLRETRASNRHLFILTSLLSKRPQLLDNERIENLFIQFSAETDQQFLWGLINNLIKKSNYVTAQKLTSIIKLELGNQTVENLLALIDATEYEEIWHEVAKRLIRFGKPIIPSLFDYVQNKLTDSRKVPVVFKIIYKIGSDDVSLLFDLLKHQNPQVRIETIACFGKFRTHAALDNIAALIGDPNEDVRIEVIRTIFVLGTNQDKLFSVMPLLDDSSAKVCEEAAKHLSTISENEDVLTAFAERLSKYPVSVFAKKTYMQANIDQISHLFPQLNNHKNQIAAQELLIQMGEKIIPGLYEYFRNNNNKQTLATVLPIFIAMQESTGKFLITLLAQTKGQDEYRFALSLLSHFEILASKFALGLLGAEETELRSQAKKVLVAKPALGAILLLEEAKVFIEKQHRTASSAQWSPAISDEMIKGDDSIPGYKQDRKDFLLELLSMIYHQDELMSIFLSKGTHFNNYHISNDFMDEGFDILTSLGNKVGQCGISNKLGRSKKINALEVWLYDDSNNETRVKIIATEDAISKKKDLINVVGQKIEIVPIRPGLRIELSTKTAQLHLLIKEVAYEHSKSINIKNMLFSLSVTGRGNQVLGAPELKLVSAWQMSVELVRMDQGWILEYLQSAKPEIRLTAFKLLVEAGYGNICNEISLAIQDNYIPLRLLAFKAAEDYGTREIALLVLKYINDNDSVVRNAALQSLPKLGHLIIPELLDAMFKTQDSSERELIENILLNLYSELMPVLVNVLLTSKIEREVQIAMKMFALIGQPAFNELPQYLNQEQDICDRIVRVLDMDPSLALDSIITYMNSLEKNDNKIAEFLLRYAAKVMPLEFPTLLVTYLSDKVFYSNNFEIVLSSNELLGAAGVNVHRMAILDNGPGKVIAFDVWLFEIDKSQTANTILDSTFGFLDYEVRNASSDYAKIQRIEAGSHKTISTNTLQLSVLIKDVGYSSGDVDSVNHFERLSVELTVSGKESSKPVYFKNSTSFSWQKVVQTIREDSNWVVAYLRDPLPEIRMTAFRLLLESGNPKLDEQIISIIKDDNISLRLVALYAAAAFQTREVGLALLQCLHEKDQRIRDAAMQSLVKIGHLILYELKQMTEQQGESDAKNLASQILVKINSNSENFD